MASLVGEIERLVKSDVALEVKGRLLEFESFKNKRGDEWFSELCFCILTANSRADTAIQIQKELGTKGFCSACAADVKKCIRKNKHRFHNNKTKFIVGAREHLGVKKIVQEIVEREGEKAAREWLVKNVKGIGFKEASHFMRNVGYKNLAILDRHILNLMLENGLIKKKPVSLNKKKYLEIEEKFRALAKKLKMQPAELDLYMWFMKTGKVLK
ncbi:MAG: N-glycosylase/DNA lyase [archaeon]|jgi:N-glycosylase/DNA lyase|nr:N-glycosylase/DNA lyase [archaeon]